MQSLERCGTASIMEVGHVKKYKHMGGHVASEWNQTRSHGGETFDG